MSPIKKTSKSDGKEQGDDFKELNGTAENSAEGKESASAKEVNEQAQMTKVFIDHDVASLENLNNGEIPEVNKEINQAKELAQQAKEEIDRIVEADKMEDGEQPPEQKAEKELPLKQTETAADNAQELKTKWLGQEVSLENNGEEEDNKKWTVIKIEDGKAILRNFSKGSDGKVITRSVDVEKLRLWRQEEYKESEHNLEGKIGIIESLKSLTALDLEELVKNEEFISSIKNALQRNVQLIFDSLSSEDKKNLSGIYLNYFIELVGAIRQSNYSELDKILEEIKIDDYQGVEEIIQSPEFKKALTQGEHSLKTGLEFIVKQKYIEAGDLQTLSILRQLDYPEINKILEEIKIGDYQGVEEIIQSPEFKLCLKSSLENDAAEIINNINNSTEIDELELVFMVNRFLKELSAIYQLNYPEINKILEEIKIGDYQGVEQVMQSAEFREALDILKKFNESSVNYEENSDYKFGKVNLLVTFNAARNIIDAYQQELSAGAQKEIVGDEAAEPIDFSQIENSFKGLHDLFNALDENLNSRGEKEGKSYDSDIIKQIILAAVEGKVALESVPTWGGLREKVAEIKAAIDKAKEEEEKAKNGPSAERIRELREKLRIFKEKRERYLKAKLAYEKVSSSFAGKKRDKKKKEAILKEFYEAQSDYYQARAEYVGGKANRFVNERLKAAEAEAELVVADKKSSKLKEKYHQVIDGFYNGYKKLGEFNLADKVLAKMLFKREQDGRVKRTIKTLVGMGGRFISARTALSFGLVGAGFLLAGTGAGALAVIPLSLRRILGTGGAAFGYYDLQRNFSKQERQIRKLKNKMADEKFHLDSLPQKELENYLNYFEVQATIDGKSPAEDKFYRQLRLEYMRRLKKEKVEKIEGRVEKTIEDKLHATDKELSGLKIQLKGKNKRRKIVALTAGAVVGSGVLFSLAREWLWGGGGEAAASAASLHGNMHNLPANGAAREALWGRTGNISSSAAADSSRHIVEAGHTAGNALSSEAVKAGAAHATGADTPVAHQFGAETASFDYQGGKSVWREISHQLRDYFKEKHLDSLLDKKNTATRTYLTDYLKDKIAAKPEDYGLPKGADINNLSQTELAKLDWDKLMRGNLQKAIDSAKSLSADAKKAILDNNQIINKLNEQDLIKDWGKADELVNEVKKNFDGSAEFYKDYQQAVQYMQEHVKNLSQQAAENSLNLHSKAALGAHIIHHHPAASTGKVESLATEVPSKEAVTSTGGTDHIKEAVQQPKHHQPTVRVEKDTERLTGKRVTQHVHQPERHQQVAPQAGKNVDHLQSQDSGDIVRQKTVKTHNGLRTIVQKNDRVSDIHEATKEYVNQAGHKVTEQTVKTTAEWGMETGLEIRQTAHELVESLPNQNKFLKLAEKIAGHKLNAGEKTYWLGQRKFLLNKYQSYGGNRNPMAFSRTLSRVTNLLEKYVAEKKVLTTKHPGDIPVSTGGTDHIKEAVQQPKHHQPAPQVEKNAEHLKTEQNTQHIQQAEEQHQPAAQVEINSHNVASGGAESEISKVDSLTQAAAQETLTKKNQNMILKVAEDYVGKKYSMGHDGYDCMTLIKEVGKKVKNNLLKEYVHFVDTHKGTHLTFNEFLKDKPVDFRDASWEVVKNKIEPGTYLVNFNSGGGVTYGPEGHGGILEVRMGPDGQKEFNLIHASTVSLKVAEHHQPLSLHELKIKVDGQTYSGRKIVTAFAKKFKNFLTRDKGGARVYKPELARKIEFYDKSGHQLHPALEKDGSLRLGYVTKETNLDSYFKYNRDFAKNMTLLRLDENSSAAIAAK